ncbi:GM24138 [Drosophila sechellia]|uniref:GM24138 n=1 Tax=Drosophila sechellia TaxID=7238 RepID=B4HF85_DROSE|nr:GM24138 [Drosophila sechellia]
MTCAEFLAVQPTCARVYHESAIAGQLKWLKDGAMAKCNLQAGQQPPPHRDPHPREKIESLKLQTFARQRLSQ